MIRLWKLGNNSEGRFATDATLQRLAHILMNQAGGPLDIIWDSDIDVVSIDGNSDDIHIIETKEGKRIVIDNYDKITKGD